MKYSRRKPLKAKPSKHKKSFTLIGPKRLPLIYSALQHADIIFTSIYLIKLGFFCVYMQFSFQSMDIWATLLDAMRI